jgi:hypothetical protein
MADYIHPDVYDNGLVTLTNATSKVLHICSAQPANYAGVAAVTLATKSSPTVSSPGARTPNGRKVTISAITDGTINTQGTGAYFALVDGTRLLAAGDCSNSQTLYTANPLSVAAIDIGIPDPA